MEIIQGHGRKILFASVAVFALFALIIGVVFVSNNGTKTVGELAQNSSVTNPTNSQKSVGLNEDRDTLASSQGRERSKSDQDDAALRFDQNIDASTTKSFISRFNLDRRHLIGLAIGGGFLLLAIATAVVVGVFYYQGVLAGVDPATMAADEEEQKRLEDAKRAEEEEAERQRKAEQEAQTFMEQTSRAVKDRVKYDFKVGVGLFFATAVLSLIGCVISFQRDNGIKPIAFMILVNVITAISLFIAEQPIGGAYMIGAICFSSCLFYMRRLKDSKDQLEDNLKAGITAFLAIVSVIGPIIDMSISGPGYMDPAH